MTDNYTIELHAEIAELKIQLANTQRQARELTEQRAALRAKVESLVSHVPDGTMLDYQWNLALNAVLALIDGEDK